MSNIIRIRGFSDLPEGINLEFTEPVPAKVLCCNCKDVVGILWRAKCQHGFCTACLETLLGQGTKSLCPVDGECIIRSELVEDTQNQIEVAPLRVNCPYRNDGCQDILRICTLNVHMQYTHIRPSAPPQQPSSLSLPGPSTGQQVEATVSDSKGHACTYCQEVFASSEEMTRHAETCPQRGFECWMSLFGCSFKGSSQSELEDHENDWASHRRMVVTRLMEYKRSIEDVQAERDLLRNQLNEAQNTVRNVQAALQSYQTESQTKQDDFLRQIRETSVRITMLERETNITKHQLQEIRKSPGVAIPLGLNAAANQGLPSPTASMTSLLPGFPPPSLAPSTASIAGDTDDVICSEGVFIWKLLNYHRVKSKERHSHKKYTSSPTFYTGVPGYRMQVRVYLNGIGQSRRGKFVGVNLVLLKGRHDNEVEWPFRQKIVVMLMDQLSTNHLQYTINDPGFPRPQSEHTIPYGWQEFISHQEMESEQRGFLKDDSIMFKVSVTRHIYQVQDLM